MVLLHPPCRIDRGWRGPPITHPATRWSIATEPVRTRSVTKRKRHGVAWS